MPTFLDNDPRHRTLTRRGVARAAAAAAAALCCANLARAAEGTWANPAGGYWSDPGNWTPTVPSNPGDTARFPDLFPASPVVTLDSARSVGHLIFDTRKAYTLQGGQPLTLVVPATATGAAATITSMRGTNVVEAPILLGSPLLVDNRGGHLSFKAPIGGNHAVTFSSTWQLSDNVSQTNLDAPNTYTGKTTVVGQSFSSPPGTVFVNQSQALGSSGRLDLRGGRLWVGAPITLDRFSLYGDGILTGTAPVTLTNPTLELRGGTIDFDRFTPGGALLGVSHVEKRSMLPAFVGATGSQWNPAVVVRRGGLFISGAATFNQSITVAGSTLASVQLGAFYGDVFLNNATGEGFSGAVRGGAGAVGAAGRLDLGAIGSIVAGGTFSGPVVGGALTVRDYVTLAGPASHTGPTTIGYGTNLAAINLSGNGKLTATPSINVNSEAVLGIVGEPATGDRVADHVPIHLRGGSISMQRASGQPTAETLGPVHLDGGRATVSVSQFAAAERTVLTLQSLSRSRGSTLALPNVNTLYPAGEPGPEMPRILFATAPALSGGILGGWATAAGGTTYDFATYNAERGLHALGAAGRPTSLNGSGPGDNVVLGSGTTTLTADATVNSLKGQGAHLNLGGNTLNLISGGLLQLNSIANGRLTAGGSSAGAELFVHGSFGSSGISAEIVDNAGGAVSLVTSDAFVTLSGNNTYSGGTYANGQVLQVDTPGALPAGTDLSLVRTTFRVNYASPSPIRLGTLSLVGNTHVVNYQSQGGPGVGRPAVEAEEYRLESGVVDRISFAGAGPLRKTTFGTLELLANNSGYSGPVTIESGVLIAGGAPAVAPDQRPLGTGRVTVLAGRLVHDGGLIDNPITLDGGELGARGPDERTFAGPITVMNSAAVVNFDAGAGPTTLRNRDPAIRLSGSLTLSAGSTLTKLGPGRLTFDRPIIHGPGATIVVEEGPAMFNADAGGSAGRNSELALSAGLESVLTFNASQHVKSLALADEARAEFLPVTDHTRVLRAGTLTLADEGTLDLGGGGLVLDYAGSSPVDAIRDEIVSGRNGGRWDGHGITADFARTNPRASVGYAEASSILSFTSGETAFMGEAVDPTTVLVRATLAGDTNLDGRVAFEDLVRLAQHYNSASPAHWDVGDFNYDRAVDFRDLVMMAQNYDTGLGQFAAAVAAAQVPEPTGAGVTSACAAWLLGARRRRQSPAT